MGGPSASRVPDECVNPHPDLLCLLKGRHYHGFPRHPSLPHDSVGSQMILTEPVFSSPMNSKACFTALPQAHGVPFITCSSVLA